MEPISVSVDCWPQYLRLVKFLSIFRVFRPVLPFLFIFSKILTLSWKFSCINVYEELEKVEYPVFSSDDLMLKHPKSQQNVTFLIFFSVHLFLENLAPTHSPWNFHMITTQSSLIRSTWGWWRGTWNDCDNQLCLSNRFQPNGTGLLRRKGKICATRRTYTVDFFLTYLLIGSLFSFSFSYPSSTSQLLQASLRCYYTAISVAKYGAIESNS